jgi:SulP family sulfate permease
MSKLARLVPLARSLDGYSSEKARGDLSAGLTVGVMLIPQGMAYAMIAGLPPIYGLYAALVPLLGYALLGSSRQLAVGPVAMVSLLVAAGVAPLAAGDPERYVALAILLAAIAGVIQLGLGVARFGFLVNFLSHPVLAGFTSAAAIIIGMSQLKHLLGIDLPRSHHVHEILLGAVERIGEASLPTVAIAAGSVLLLLSIKRWKRTAPGPLAVVVLGILATWGLGLYDAGVRIVGEVPRGLPSFHLPTFQWGDVTALIPAALTISLVGFMESVAVAKVYAARNRYEIDANRELVGLGFANLAGALFRSYPVTGGFSRTAVNAQAGAQTPLAGVLSAGVIALTLLFLTPLFYYLPNAVLGAVIVVAVAGLVDIKEALFLWRVERRDFALMVITFAATLLIGIEQGIVVGVIVSLILIIHQISRPHSAVMGRLPGTRNFRNVERNPEAVAPEGMAILRIDASLSFANAAFLKERIRRVVAGDSLDAVVLDAYPVNRMDSTAVHALVEVADELERAGVELHLTGVKGPVRDVMARAGLCDRLGSDHFHMDVARAVDALEEQRARRASEVDQSSRGRGSRPTAVGARG